MKQIIELWAQFNAQFRGVHKNSLVYMEMFTQLGNKRGISLAPAEKPCQRYCILFNSSRHGIERLEICESKDDKNPKIITLENCVKITQESSPANIIQIVKKTETVTLNALTDEALREWTCALQMVAFREKATKKVADTAIEEENDLYCSSFGDGIFIITLIPSDTSIRCNIESKIYVLHLASTELQLKCSDDHNIVVAKWPYRFIRKYGYRDGKFTFEAGRKCFTGEGIFTLDHTNPQEIFRCMSAKMKSMKKFINCDNFNNETNESHWSVAAAMEAGSRSPLPLVSQQSPDIDTNCQCGPISPINKLSGNISSNSTSSPLQPLTYTALNKSTKKMQSNLDKVLLVPTMPISQLTLSKSTGEQTYDILRKYQNYDSVSITTSGDPNKTVGSTVILKPNSPETFRRPNTPIRKESVQPHVSTELDYESIEMVKDAWKTLGISSVIHTERNINAIRDEEVFDLNLQHSIALRDKCPLKETFYPAKTPTLVDIDIGEGKSTTNSSDLDDTYDRLDFMTPNNKVSSGYKTIISVISSSRHSLSSDYESIANSETELLKKLNGSAGSEDSHELNIDFVKKSSVSNVNDNSIKLSNLDTSVESNIHNYNNELLDHGYYSGLSYTVVSKPKRV